MKDRPMMQCGHAANARTMDDKPCCAICVGLHPGAMVVEEERPDLAGREARCSCGRLQPSDPPDRLAFFEYRGLGSREARERCANCGYYYVAHTTGRIACRKFFPHGPFEYDAYYCGHAGWD